MGLLDPSLSVTPTFLQTIPIISRETEKVEDGLSLSSLCVLGGMGPFPPLTSLIVYKFAGAWKSDFLGGQGYGSRALKLLPGMGKEEHCGFSPPILLLG